MDLITFKKVNFYYNKKTSLEKHALIDISLPFAKGKFHTIVGKTGSGKSTLMQHFNCLLLPDEGEVIIDKYVIKGKNFNKKDVLSIRQKISLLFQFSEMQLFADTVQNDIMFGPLNFGATPKQAQLIAQQVIDLVGLDQSYLKRPPLNLSGGEKRRVALAGVLAINPQVLILDEPTIGLDSNGQKKIMGIIDQFLKQNKTVILITHNMEDLWQYSEITTLIDKGKIIIQKPTKEFFDEKKILTKYNLAKPQIKYVMDFLRKKNYHFTKRITNVADLVMVIKNQKREQ